MRAVVIVCFAAACLSRPSAIRDDASMMPPIDGSAASGDGAAQRVELKQLTQFELYSGSDALASLPSPVEAGDSVIGVATFEYSIPPAVTWSDDAGDTWNSVVRVCSANSTAIAIGYLEHPLGSPGRVRFTLSGNASGLGLGLYEFSGIGDPIMPVSTCPNADTYVDTPPLSVPETALLLAVFIDPDDINLFGITSPFTTPDESMGYELAYANGSNMMGEPADMYTASTMQKNMTTSWLSTLAAFDVP